MSNKQRKVSLDDYESCYRYFERAIQNNRFMMDEQYVAIRGCHLVGVMMNSIIDDEEDYMLLPQAEYEKLSQYSYKKVHQYFDENEPLGGWWDPKKHPFR
jgi:hypothetical protein